jgi:hypothetical protein
MMRNDLHIFIDDRLFFGENTHPSSQISAYQSRFSDRAQRHLWGNLCSCMSTVLGLVDGYSYSFRPKEPSSDESIAWDLQSRQTFGSCKAYYFLGTRIQRQYISILNLLSSLISGTGSCSSPEGAVHYITIVPRPRIRGKASMTTSPMQKKARVRLRNVPNLVF